VSRAATTFPGVFAALGASWRAWEGLWPDFTVPPCDRRNKSLIYRRPESAERKDSQTVASVSLAKYSTHNDFRGTNLSKASGTSKSGGVMRPLIDVAVEIQVDYQRLRNAAIRGEVTALREHGRWLVDPTDAARWKRGLVPSPTENAS
jgi:hypothetical protein